ncbi:MAG: phosphotransferase [Acidimicrobiia bacterium]
MVDEVDWASAVAMSTDARWGNEMTSNNPNLSLAERVASALTIPQVELRPAAGGAGNLAFEVHDPSLPGAPVAFLRCKQGDGGREEMGYTLVREAALLRQAERMGFPVAPVVATFTDPDAILMRVVPGTSRPEADEIEIVGPKYMALIAAVHASDSSLYPVEQHATMTDAIAAELALWTNEARDRGVMDIALTALAQRILTEQMPNGSQRPSLVHGDVGAGNFMCQNGEVTAMLDWELAHLSDPHEDLAWMWMRGAHTSFGDPQRRIAEYAAASGASVDRQRLDWFLALVMWKSVVSVQSRLLSVVPGELAMISTIVRLTYDALLGNQLVKLLGGSLPLLTQTPERSNEPEANLAEELLTVGSLAPDQRVVVEFLRDSAANGPWERRCLEDDCRSLLGISTDELRSHIDTCPSDELLPLAMVVGRLADRKAQAMPKAVRRIERAQRIGLGVA